MLILTCFSNIIFLIGAGWAVSFQSRVQQYRCLIIRDFEQIRLDCLKLLACCKSVMFNSSYYRLKPCSCQNYTILSSLYTQNSRDTKDDITWYRFSSVGGRDHKRQNWPKGTSASSEQFYSWSHWENPENIASVWKVCCFQFLKCFPDGLSQTLPGFQWWIGYMTTLNKLSNFIICICFIQVKWICCLSDFIYFTFFARVNCSASCRAAKKNPFTCLFPECSVPLSAGVSSQNWSALQQQQVSCQRAVDPVPAQCPAQSGGSPGPSSATCNADGGPQSQR